MPSIDRAGLARPARPDIIRSWGRSRLNGGVDSTRLEIDRTEADVDSSFVTAAAPVLLSVTDMLAGTSTSLALADPPGGELAVAIGFVDHRVARSFGVRTRITLRGTCAGTNGIGLAIASRRPPVRVIGAEHYKQMWDVWACFAAPVADPITGQMAGLVNITCRAESANHFLAVALRSLTDRIGVALRDAAAPATAPAVGSLSPVPRIHQAGGGRPGPDVAAGRRQSSVLSP